MSGTLLNNPARLTGFLDATTKAITADDHTSFGDLRNLASSLHGLNPKRVVFYTAPIANRDYSPPGHDLQRPKGAARHQEGRAAVPLDHRGYGRSTRPRRSGLPRIEGDDSHGLLRADARTISVFKRRREDLHTLTSRVSGAARRASTGRQGARTRMLPMIAPMNVEDLRRSNLSWNSTASSDPPA